MAIDNVRKYLERYEKSNEILEFDVSSATVELAAAALNVEPAMIAKTIALKNGDSCVLVVTAGDTKIDNKKFKSFFSFKAKMLSPEDTLNFTGHKIGGVCPFAIDDNINIYLDTSLQRFDYVYPACGSSNSAIKLSCNELLDISQAKAWIDVCNVREEN